MDNQNNTQNIDTANVFEMAIILGKALKADPRLVRMEAARKAYEEDKSLTGLMSEYDVQQKAMQNVAAGESFEPQLMEMIQARINELYDLITKHPTYIELNTAQEAVNELMNSVNNTIMFTITGEMPSDCTHDCSTCSGCH